ncbi:hypothetical protein ACOMHN_059025 [Nucella lapillus]
MEKLGDESAAKFINALIKSVQTLCHGYLDFQNGIEIIGHINLSVDKGSSLDYILKEKVCKNAENSTLFISNSFHAEPKPDQEVSGKTSHPGNQVSQNSESPDTVESGKVSSAISSISSALTELRERSRRNSGAKDSSSSLSQPNTVKRKASEDESGEFRPAKISYHDRLSHVTSESSHPLRSSSPVDSKEALQALRTGDTDLSETVLPQTASIRSDVSDIGVNLAGSVLEPVEGQNNPDFQERDEDSDGDLEVTFIKEEYVEGEESACDFDGQHFMRGPQQRASDGMPDPSLFSLGPQSSSASATYVPSAAGQQQFPAGSSTSSTSQPQPGPSGMRGLRQDSIDKSQSSAVQPVMIGSDFHTKVFTLKTEPCHAVTAANSSAMDTRQLPALSQDILPGSQAQKKQFLICEFCDATFSSSSGLRMHTNDVHFHRAPFICSLCGKGFQMKQLYNDHMNKHNNVKCHSCPRCLTSFTYKTSLQRHMRWGVCKKQ